MPKAKYDLNDNGKIDPEEREIMLEDVLNKRLTIRQERCQRRNG